MDTKTIKDITQEERDFLLHFRARPGMYIGNNSINSAYTFLLGYKMALFNTKQTNKLIIPNEFTEYTALKYGKPSPMGWCRIILEQVNDEEKALWLFFDLLDEFLLVNGFQIIGETPSGLWYRLRNCICRKEIFDKTDINEVLKKRNLRKFQSEWHRVINEIETIIKIQIVNEKINEAEIKKDFNNNIEDLYSSKSFYKDIIYNDIFEICGNTELAENIANDIDMIYVGSLINYNDNWLNEMISEYKQYSIPC